MGPSDVTRGPCQVVELRQYELVPGRRDELIELFDRALVETQEQVGIHVLGQFRDVDRPDRFTWLRGFPSMVDRRAALEDFYLKGEAWAANRVAANATMVDSDNVLLLQPVAGMPTLCSHAGQRAAPGGRAVPGGVLTVSITDVSGRPDQVPDIARRAVAQGPGTVIGVLRSDHSPNTFPQLPVVADADVLVVVRRHPAGGDLGDVSAGALVLEPTGRSALR